MYHGLGNILTPEVKNMLHVSRFLEYFDPGDPETATIKKEHRDPGTPTIKKLSVELAGCP